jgi:hypothetical protein
LKRFFVGATLCAFTLPGLAAATTIPVGLAIDMVHDESRGIIYISTQMQPQVLRYQLSTVTFLTPINVGSILGGVDISPDNRYLVVAERSNPGGSCVHIIDLDSLAQQLACTPLIGMENGSAYAVYGADGKIYVAATAFNMYEAPLRKLDPATGQWTVLTTSKNDTRITPSGDAQAIGFIGQPYSATSQWGFVDVPTGLVVRRDFPQSRSASLMALDRFGAQSSVLGQDAAYVFDDAYALVGSIQGNSMTCLAYHPVERLAYVCPFSGTTAEVKDTNSFVPVGSIDFGSTGLRDLRFSRDGSLVMARSFDGVNFVQQYAPLQAGSINTSTGINQAKAITLVGSVGNGGAVSYSIASVPGHGTVSLNGVSATYTPTAGYVGADSFTYRVQYGRAARTGTVSVSVIDTNRPPTAVNDSAQTRNTAIQIPVLANDSDPDGDSISLVSLTVPTAGTAAIQGTKVLFTPPKKWPSAPVTFNYTIKDPRGKTATAQVTVSRN